MKIASSLIRCIEHTRVSRYELIAAIGVKLFGQLFILILENSNPVLRNQIIKKSPIYKKVYYLVIVTRVDEPSVGLLDNGWSEVLVAIPPV